MQIILYFNSTNFIYIRGKKSTEDAQKLFEAAQQKFEEALLCADTLKHLILYNFGNLLFEMVCESLVRIYNNTNLTYF